MNILIADSFPETHRQSLTADGHQVTFNPELDVETLVQAVTDIDVLVVRSTKVSANTLSSGNKLKLVVRAGAGTNTIDKTAASDLGIKVCNVPGANANAVAELVMGLIISIDRNIPANTQDLKNGIWNKKKYSKARGLYGRSLGILGAGAIGMAVAERASAFGMDVYVVSKANRSEAMVKRMLKSSIQQVPTTAELLAQCDIVSLHLPATDTTRGMVNKEFLSQMKQGAMLINTSRGELIDEQSLIDALNSKDMAAGLDVYANEPASGDNIFASELASHPNVCGTHHIGASTEQAQTAVANGALKVIDAFQQGQVLNCVNL